MSNKVLRADIAAQPALQPIPLHAINSVSPWIERIVGLEKFEKTVRDKNVILQEYNDGHYKDLLNLWEGFVAKSPNAPLQLFFNEYDRYHSKMIEERKHIYRSSTENYLFSIGDEFYTCDLNLGTMMFRNIVTRTVDDVLRAHNVSSVVELGCGIGINVLSIYHHSAPAVLRGGDICSNAVELGNRMAQKHSIPATFSIFDYESKESLRQMTDGLDNYILITVHSIEQIQVEESKIIENICSLPNPPKAVVHFEPIAWTVNENSGVSVNMMDKFCQRYAELNKYNMDLFTTLERLEQENALVIKDVRKRVWGISPFNPTNIIVWQPR